MGLSIGPNAGPGKKPLREMGGKDLAPDAPQWTITEVNPDHELTLSGVAGLVTTKDAPAPYNKSDGVTPGVNTRIPIPNAEPLPVHLQAAGEQPTEREKRHKKYLLKFKKIIAAATAALFIFPVGMARSSTTEVVGYQTTTVSGETKAPIDCDVEIDPYSWDKTNSNQQNAEEAAQEIEQCIDDAIDDANAQVPGGATTGNPEVDVQETHVEGGADDSHHVGPDSDNKNLGQEDPYNDQLAKDRGEGDAANIEKELQDAGIDPGTMTTDGHETTLTPEQIETGNEIARRYGYNDFDELIQAVEHGRTKLNQQDQEVYDSMITQARKTKVGVEGEVTAPYSKTTETPIRKTTEHTTAFNVMIPGIATEEQAPFWVKKTKQKPPRTHLAERPFHHGHVLTSSSGGGGRGARMSKWR